jgi:hypothetical protein
MGEKGKPMKKKKDEPTQHEKVMAAKQATPDLAPLAAAKKKK